MNITRTEILHLATLSNLTLSEAEITALQTDLSHIVQYISSLSQIDTTNVVPTYQVSPLENIWRPDEITPQEATPDQLLALAPDLLDQQIKVPKVL